MVLMPSQSFKRRLFFSLACFSTWPFSSMAGGATRERQRSGTCNHSARLHLSQTRYRLDAHLPVLEQQFSKPKHWIQDGYSDFFNFSTGRRNVASLHAIFALQPRHDFFQWAFQIGRTFVDLQYRPKDDLQLDFKLLPGALAHDFVWAVVSKDELLSVKNDRWDLVSAYPYTLLAILSLSCRLLQKRQKTRASPRNSPSCLVGISTHNILPNLTLG